MQRLLPIAKTYQRKKFYNMYKLLPFNFTRIAGHEVLVNEIGDMQIVPNGTVDAIVNKSLPKNDLYKTLVANFFITEDKFPPLFNIYASRLFEKKRFLDDFTGLHIFVLTLRCNQNCVYCQASSQDENALKCSMTKESMEKAVRMMFKSKSPHLTMEFQGGEPSLMPDLIEYGAKLAHEINEVENRNINYVLCTNSVNLTDKMLSICKQYDITISTSLDGPAFLHNSNRGKENSYERVTAGIQKARGVLGYETVAALMTTSVQGLDYPKEIIDAYIENGFNCIFLRALNPYGLALKTENWEEYTDRYIEFYKKALDYIIELNLQGKNFREDFAAIILKKMLTPYCTSFVDMMSPAGIINSVLIYNYDGYVYASDESRMLAEYNDYTFRLGSLDDKYEDIVFGEKAKKIAKISANEVLAGCNDCALRHFCCADPVRNHSTQGDMYGFRPTSLLCKKNKAIIEHLITLIIERGDEVLPIFKNWTIC